MVKYTSKQVTRWKDDRRIRGKFGRVTTKKGRVFEGTFFIEPDDKPPVLLVVVEDFTAPKQKFSFEARGGDFHGEISVQLAAVHEIVLLPCPDCGAPPEMRKCYCPF